MEALRLLSAFQVLTLHSGAYGVTHARARDVIAEMLGHRPIRGRKPPMPPRGHEEPLQFYLDWLGDNCKPEPREEAV